MFKLDLAAITRYINVYELLFNENLPYLYAHFQAVNIFPQEYLLSWFSTIFSQVFPLNVASRVWDGFLQEGEIYLYKTTLGALKLFSSKLLSSFEECRHILKHFPKNIDDKELFESIDSIVVPAYTQNFVLRIASEGFVK